MGTGGIWGFEKDSVKKVTYNHWNSYPTGLGETIREYLESRDIKFLATIFDKIEMVDQDSVPTPGQINRYERFFNSKVSTGQPTEWYALLRATQGNPEAYDDPEVCHMIDSAVELEDTDSWCEWGYIINLDNNTIDICDMSSGVTRTFPIPQFVNMDMGNLERRQS